MLLIKSIIDAHNQGVCHGDFDLTKFYLNSKHHLKIIGWGESKPIRIYGMRYNMIPETLDEGFPRDHSERKEADLWAVAVVVFYLWFRNPPYSPEQIHQYKSLEMKV